ncbi:50S ribosomal protein L11 methyltransferase [Parasphingopyxis lamellibrachiae]|uniref:Ribosomal protein L11 methyltransferase n=1 Tax=Parasphingopyxis lamellibrachiae TaxID=680125 RepID=A0A3D9FIZ3_9SPHN|nr:[LSU ribosomal protein L11P]-lysine N-methyltransferase [Parasphingopyxis lamellibrachiae]
MESWKLTLPCTRAEAEILKEDIAPFVLLEPVPVLMTSEIDPAAPDDWQLDIYFEEEPSAATVTMAKQLVPSSADTTPVIIRLDDQDWVAISQEGLAPIREGRFFVHTPIHRDEIPEGALVFEIDAGQAFGTGHHETTAGCLAILDTLKSQGRRYRSIADIGTGTGILAFAAMALWPNAETIASDIDPLAIEVAEQNAAINAVRIGRGSGQVEMLVAAGLAHRRLRARAPYDLLIANILAGPLIELAPIFGNGVAPGGTLVLAGLLDKQADAVASAYRRNRFRLAERLNRGEWSILRLEKRRVRGHRPASRG